MMKIITVLAAGVGAWIVHYVSGSYWGQDHLALGIVGLISAGFGVGLVELWRHGGWMRACGAELDSLDTVAPAPREASESLPDLSRLSPRLRRVVEGRLLGHSVALPTPTATSYLLGLLVMLGVLGTFLGMVDTLQGARAVLAGSNEIETMREGLVAPVMGLSRAFGTSVAGVALSALLGVVAVLVRRERAAVHRQISQHLSTSLYRWSVAGRQLEALEALTRQLATVPVAMDHFGELTESVGGFTRQMQESQETLARGMADKFEDVSERLVKSQEALSLQAGEMLEVVSDKVAETMEAGTTRWVEVSTREFKPMLEEAAQRAGESAESHFAQWTSTLEDHAAQRMVEQEKWTSDFKGLVVALTDTIAAQEAERLDAINEQLSALIDRFKAGLLGLGDENRECLARFTTPVGGLEVSMERLLENIRAEHEGLGARLVTLSGEFHGQQEKLGLQLSEQLGALGGRISENMGALESLQLESAEKALVSIERLDEVVKEQLVELGAGLGRSLEGVVESAEKAPRAAAEVLGKLQGRVEDQIQRENALLEERMTLLEGLGEVATQLQGAAGAHGEAISAMTLKADEQLKQVAEHSRDELEQTRGELREAAELIGVGGHEMSVLTEMFSQAVSEYRTSNEQLLGGLDRVEEALSHAGERSDQQLNFYVSQAREILDHSMLSQKEVFDELKHLRLSQTVEENV